MGDVERSRLKSECPPPIYPTESNDDMVNYPHQWTTTQHDENHHDEPPGTVDDTRTESCCNDTASQRKRKKSECDDFLGFKKHCIEEATDMYRKCLKYSTLSNSFDVKGDVNGFDDPQASTKSEYAQYLGLQPTVKFKCIKCSTTNFPTLTALNKHLEKCPETIPANRTTDDATSTPALATASNATSSSTTNFKITRRVYLCSACGVYFEIWKLFLHMRTAHRRYICLICLGLFSIAEKLSNHLIVKHNILAKNYDNLTNFFNDFSGQNFIMCCQCEKMFTEKDNFAEHVCELNGNNTTASPSVVKQDYLKKVQQKTPTSSGKSTPSILNKINTTPSKLKNKILPSEHVTADTPPNEDNSENEAVPTETVQTPGDESKDEITPVDDDQKIKIDESLPVTPLKADENCTAVSETTSSLDTDDKSKINESIEETLEESAENVSKNESSENVETQCDNSMTCDTNDGDNEVMLTSTPATAEQRRVPKVTLKIPPQINKSGESGNEGEKEDISEDSESDDSFKLTMDEDDVKKDVETFPIADVDIPIVELGLRPPLDKVSIQSLLKDFIRVTCYTCIYCNHARKIAVNGKQLGLHMIAEHRFSATADSITAEELLPETFVKRIRDDFDALSSIYFNLESYDDSAPDTMIPYDRTYECFQCRFVTTVHKELYLHNRKMHQKTLLLCIMCKSTFFSYSELLCHLCPGVYLGDVNILFRCCLCPINNVPSAFRLMVHLRKRHHACDVCLETCNSQSKLSNHVWKHKLHHLCYRCGIAYRNKPDITKHLFWKHGTESVLCKKCLQKKWPHVYHFCIPPVNFICEECNKVFSKAVALKVHKRLHSNTKPYACTEPNCSDAFVSRKLLDKHLFAHKEPASLAPESDDIDVQDDLQPRVHSPAHEVNITLQAKENEQSDNVDDTKVKPVVDVLDLPALNLSESDSSDSEDDTSKPAVQKVDEPPPPAALEEEHAEVDNAAPVVIENIWDDFKNYQASVEKRNTSPSMGETENGATLGNADQDETEEVNRAMLLDVIMTDHDYLPSQPNPVDEVKSEPTDVKTEKDKLDHNYCDPQSKENEQKDSNTSKVASDSSSDSDSSSCSCGSNCSCSSSSSNGSSSSSSSSSDSDSSSSDDARRKENLERKQKRKERAKSKKKISETSSNIDVVHVEDAAQPVEPPAPPVLPVIPDIPIYESDLVTDESETDEDFYDECPQLLAKKLIEEKKNQLLLDVGGPPLSAINGTSFLETSRSSTPNLPVEEQHQQLMIKLKKPKNKTKKRKKSQKKLSPRPGESILPPLKLNIPHSFFKSSPTIHQMQLTPTTTPQVAPSPSIFTSSSQGPPSVMPTTSTPLSSSALLYNSNTGSGSETDSALRLSKRRRVPNKFYGYSSDEDQPHPMSQQRILNKIAISTEPPQLQWNKEDLPSPPPRVSTTPPYVPPPVAWNTKIASPPTTLQSTVIHHTPPPPVAPSSSSSESDAPDSDDEQRLHIQDYAPSPITIQHVAPPTPAMTPSQIQPTGPISAPSIGSVPPTVPPSLLSAPRPAENLYCYCQCPYDEVSEMIACDGKKCAIEWFHFECVGIMVPPKGKWFCPDCRKQTSQQQRPEYFMSQ